MKLYQVFLLALVALMLTIAQEGQGRTRDFNVTITTMSNTTIAAVPGRKYFLAINESPLYTIRIATGTWDQGATYKGLPIAPNYGSWEDGDYTDQTAWYVMIDSAGAPADTAALGAAMTYRQKD